MLADIKPLVEGGFAVHLLRKQSKTPADSRWSTAEVASYGDLKSAYQKGMNVGVRLGEPSIIDDYHLMAIDLDIRVAEDSDEAHAALEDIFHGYKIKRFWRVRSGSGGESRHFYFLCDQAFPSKMLARSDNTFIGDDGRKHRNWEIELFGTGKQTVLPPSIHPDTNAAYSWEVEPDFDFDLPVVSSNLLNSLVYQDGRQGSALDEAAEPMGLEIREAESILEDLEDWADDRDTWLRVGMALKHEFGKDGWRLFDEWSKKGRGYNARVNREQWRSFKVNRNNMVTMRSLAFESNERAVYASLADMDDLDGDVEFDVDEFDDLEELTPEPKNGAEPAKTSKLSKSSTKGVAKHLLTVPGKLQHVVDFYNKNAMVDQPEFAVLAALAYGSVVLGRNARTDFHNYSSLYFIGVGDTGSGKESIRSTITYLLEKSGLGLLAGPENYTSEGAVLSQLMASPKSIMLGDEFGKRMGDDRRGGGGSPKDGMYTAFLSLFSKLDSSWRPAGYSTMGKSKEEAAAILARQVERPALTIMAVTTPSTLMGAIDGADLSSGFLNRFIIVQTNNGFQRQRIFATQKSIPNELITWTKFHANRSGEPEDSEADMMLTIDQSALVEPYVLKFSAKAADYLSEIEDIRVSRQEELAQNGLSDLFSRSREIAMRLALIIAASDDIDRIELRHLKWAWDYVFHYHNETAKAFMANLGRGALHQLSDDLAERIIARKEKGMSLREIGKSSRQYQALTTRDSDEVLRLLKRDHGIVEGKISGRGGPKKLVYLSARYAV